MSGQSLRITTVSRCALPFVLVLAFSSSSAFSQTPVCHSIRGGETATQLARRLTGDGRNKYQTWFQIMDASSRFIPKSQYDRIRPGWSACLVKQTIETGSVQPETERETGGSPLPAVAPEGPPPTMATVIRPWDGADLRLVWLGALVIVPLVGWKVVDGYLARKKTALIIMRHFAHRFVREFERPLIQQPAELPLRARLHLSPIRGHVEILLAPGDGRRYPNLSDHRKNVEYDVVRIAQLLGDDSFVRGPIYARAEWVVVPFRFSIDQKHTGVR